MTLNQVLIIVLSTLFVGTLTSSLVLLKKNDTLKEKLTLCELNNSTLESSIAKQNEAIEKLKAETKEASLKYNEVSKKYNTLKNTSRKERVKELSKTGISKDCAKSKANEEVIEDALDVFFKK